MAIRGWTRTSLIDFPGHIASVLFYGGCNFRCPMCHNGDLVLSPDVLPEVPEERILAYLERRQGKITGVVLTGGEPTLHSDIASFIIRIQALGYAIKLDTNGYRPHVLERLLDAQLIDFVAMDIKAPPDKYAWLAGLDALDLDKIAESVRILAQSGLAHEYRTTVVPTFFSHADIAELTSWLSSLDSSDYAFYLQQFRGGNTLSESVANLNPYPAQVLVEMQQMAKQSLPKVFVRGI